MSSCKVCHGIVNDECGTIDSEDQYICDGCALSHPEKESSMPEFVDNDESTISPSSSPVVADSNSLSNMLKTDGRNCCDPLEMTPPDWVKEKYLGNVFEQNEAWRQAKLKIDPEYFTTLGSVHKPKYMWIGMYQDRYEGFLLPLHTYSLSQLSHA
jgi:hypothetical protein